MESLDTNCRLERSDLDRQPPIARTPIHATAAQKGRGVCCVLPSGRPGEELGDGPGGFFGRGTGLEGSRSERGNHRCRQPLSCGSGRPSRSAPGARQVDQDGPARSKDGCRAGSPVDTGRPIAVHLSRSARLLLCWAFPTLMKTCPAGTIRAGLAFARALPPAPLRQNVAKLSCACVVDPAYP
jgi:hypothetical protein